MAEMREIDWQSMCVCVVSLYHTNLLTFFFILRHCLGVCRSSCAALSSLFVVANVAMHAVLLSSDRCAVNLFRLCGDETIRDVNNIDAVRHAAQSSNDTAAHSTSVWGRRCSNTTENKQTTEQLTLITAYTAPYVEARTAISSVTTQPAAMSCLSRTACDQSAAAIVAPLISHSHTSQHITPHTLHTYIHPRTHSHTHRHIHATHCHEN